MEEFDASPRPRQRRRTAEPTEPTEPAEQAAAEASIAQRRAAGQPSSRFAGVSWRSRPASGRHWQASIKRNSKKQHVGCFADEHEAARAFDAAARRLRGNQAHGGRAALPHGGGKIWRLNFPTEVLLLLPKLPPSNVISWNVRTGGGEGGWPLGVGEGAGVVGQEGDQRGGAGRAAGPRGGLPAWPGGGALIPPLGFAFNLMLDINLISMVQEEAIGEFFSAVTALRLARGVGRGLLGPAHGKGSGVYCSADCICTSCVRSFEDQMDAFYQRASRSDGYCDRVEQLFVLVYGSALGAVRRMTGWKAMLELANLLFDAAEVNEVGHIHVLERTNRGPHAAVEAAARVVKVEQSR
eukprot:COSAG04_NODE_1547_length_6397_cov_31.714513_4_plen_353_part_00